jgi:hypothetical protein
MSACALKRWGAGTPCVREPATAAAKEVSDKLAAMRAEREKQDGMWSAPAVEATAVSTKSDISKGYSHPYTENTLYQHK